MLYLRCVYKRISLGHCGLLSLRKVDEIMVPSIDTELCGRRMNLLGPFEHAYKLAYTWTYKHIQSYIHIQVQYVNAVVGVKKLLWYKLKQAKISKIPSTPLYHGIIMVQSYLWGSFPELCFLKNKHQTAVILKEYSFRVIWLDKYSQTVSMKI